MPTSPVVRRPRLTRVPGQLSAWTPPVRTKRVPLEPADPPVQVQGTAADLHWLTWTPAVPGSPDGQVVLRLGRVRIEAHLTLLQVRGDLPARPAWQIRRPRGPQSGRTRELRRLNLGSDLAVLSALGLPRSGNRDWLAGQMARWGSLHVLAARTGWHPMSLSQALEAHGLPGALPASAHPEALAEDDRSPAWLAGHTGLTQHEQQAVRETFLRSRAAEPPEMRCSRALEDAGDLRLRAVSWKSGQRLGDVVLAGGTADVTLDWQDTTLQLQVRLQQVRVTGPLLPAATGTAQARQTLKHQARTEQWSVRKLKKHGLPLYLNHAWWKQTFDACGSINAMHRQTGYGVSALRQAGERAGYRRWADRVYSTRKIPDEVRSALRTRILQGDYVLRDLSETFRVSLKVILEEEHGDQGGRRVPLNETRRPAPSPNTVQRIRARMRRGSYSLSELAREFDLSRDQVKRIENGDTQHRRPNGRRPKSPPALPLSVQGATLPVRTEPARGKTPDPASPRSTDARAETRHAERNARGRFTRAHASPPPPEE